MLSSPICSRWSEVGQAVIHERPQGAPRRQRAQLLRKSLSCACGLNGRDDALDLGIRQPQVFRPHRVGLEHAQAQGAGADDEKAGISQVETKRA